MFVKKICAIVIVILLFLAAAWAWYCFNGGISHRDICQTVCGESSAIQERMDRRFQEVDAKLDRIEGKLDRLLKIAERPLPDGMQEAR